MMLEDSSSEKERGGTLDTIHYSYHGSLPELPPKRESFQPCSWMEERVSEPSSSFSLLAGGRRRKQEEGEGEEAEASSKGLLLEAAVTVVVSSA